MRYYHRTKQDKLDLAYNRCFIDAQEGRVWLALMRLQDLADEFPKDAHVIYAEALIRKDYLGQGACAYALLTKAYQLDNRLKEAACNAAKFAPSMREFDIWSATALEVAPEDTALQALMTRHLACSSQGLPYWRFLHMGAGSLGEQSYGTTAALLELALQAGGTEMTPREKANCHRVRAESLRALDRAAEDHLQALGEQSLPQDRLALQEALAELERALSDEGSEAFYDPELWNLRAAWAYLMREYRLAITYVDQAVQYRPVAYALPHLNKALSLWELDQNAEALACAKEALHQAEASQNEAHQEQVKQAIEDHTKHKAPETLDELRPYLEQVLYGAGDAAEREISDERGKLEDVGTSLCQRVQIVGHAWSMDYVTVLAELLSFYSPEAAFFIVEQAAEGAPNLLDNILNAALFLAGYGEGVSQRDSARLLALEIISALEANAIRNMYRKGILEVSSAATDELTQLDSLLRKELLRMHPLLPPLIADQKPVDDLGRERARRNILSKFSESPPLVLSAQAKPRACLPVFVVLFVVILLAIPVITVFAFSSPICLVSFLVGAIPTLLYGMSRTVVDPVFGIENRTTLSPQEFHRWADVITSAGPYQRQYEAYVYDPSRGYDGKLPLVFAQLKAANYVHAHKVLLIILVVLDAFCVHDVLFSDKTFTMPIVIGLLIGSLWGLALGIFVLWRTCRKAKGDSRLPL